MAWFTICSVLQPWINVNLWENLITFSDCSFLKNPVSNQNWKGSTQEKVPDFYLWSSSITSSLKVTFCLQFHLFFRKLFLLLHYNFLCIYWTSSHTQCKCFVHSELWTTTSLFHCLTMSCLFETCTVHVPLGESECCFVSLFSVSLYPQCMTRGILF